MKKYLTRHLSIRDAQDGKPIPNAVIRATRAEYSTRTQTNLDGSYTLPGITQWHFLSYLGSPGVFPSPWWCFHSFESPDTLLVEKSGYGQATRSLVPTDEVDTLFISYYRPLKVDFALQPSPRQNQ